MLFALLIPGVDEPVVHADGIGARKKREARTMQCCMVSSDAAALLADGVQRQ